MDHEVDEMPNSKRSRRSARSRAASGRRKPVKGTLTETLSRFDPLGVIDLRPKPNDAVAGYHGDGERMLDQAVRAARCAGASQ
jgi:hypothetical protein